ncbi:MAG: phosphate signaling complex protein PhoU [Alphaproteobacteria bacterium]
MESEHIVKAYDEQLAQLDRLIAEMGGLAETQLADAIAALVRRDVELAQRVAEHDARIDALEAEVDGLTMRILALRQPMAEDLRTVIAALKTASDLERIGDYARNMANRTVALTRMQPIGSAPHTVARMGTLVQGMIKNVLDAYIARDAARADDVRLRDREVDQLHTSLFRELLTYMLEDPRNITTCTHLLFIAKNVERIGDHVTNIAEHVHMMVLGETPEPGRPKGDRSSFTVLETPPRREPGATDG